MPTTEMMGRAMLVSDLCASLGDGGKKLGDLDWDRIIDTAAMDLGRFRRRIKAARLDLAADVTDYPAPADLVRFRSHSWGDAERRSRHPWDDDYPRPSPRVTVLEGEGGRLLHITPAPSAADIGRAGAVLHYHYCAGHSVGDQAAQTTVRPEDRGLLLLRAQAEAMLDRSLHQSGKPVQLRDGFSGAPRNGTPAALYGQLMKQVESQAARAAS